MNKRIRELADEARKEFLELPTGYRPEQVGMYRELMEKFAELIVQECLDIVNRKEYSYHEADPLWETSQLIKEHFGVDK